MHTHPILLRPPVWLAEGMRRAAEDHEVSRQVWMLNILAQAVLRGGYATDPEDPSGPGPDEPDTPLPGV